MPNKNIVLTEGEVVETLPNAFFRIKMNDNSLIIAHLSGKMRINHIKILTGDRVRMELSEYGRDKGRIVRRL